MQSSWLQLDAVEGVKEGTLVGNGMFGMNSDGLNATALTLNGFVVNALANGLTEATWALCEVDPDLCCAMVKSIGGKLSTLLVFMCSLGRDSVFVICFVLIITLT